MGPIQELARDLSVEERTLRRAASEGTLRARRTGPRRLNLAPGERGYLHQHWPLLSALRRALRNERGVRLAVLYGSLARGDEDEDSDLDLLVALGDDGFAAGRDLGVRLGTAAGRSVDVAHLGRVERDAPLLLDRALDEGRVLVDREGKWSKLRERRRAIRARAQRAHRRQMTTASSAIAELTGG